MNKNTATFPRPADRSARAGAALLTVMILVLVIVTSLSGMISLAFHQPITVRRVTAQIQAKAIAEAGANEAYHLLTTNFAARNNAAMFPEKSFAEGTYDVDVTPIGERQARLVSVGRVRGATARVTLDLNDTGTQTEGFTRSSPWGHSIFCNGTITLNGSGTVLGSVHANSELTQNGSIEWGSGTEDCDVSVVSLFRVNGQARIYGEVSAPDIRVSGTDNIRSKQIGPVSRVEFPANIDLSALYEIAVANGQVRAGGNYNSDVALGNIPGGVVWYNGNVRFNKSVSFAGTIIATGDIRFNGAMNQTQVGNRPSIISRDGAITINGSHTLEGMIYCPGDLGMNGSGTIRGAIVVGGNMRMNGSYGIVSYESPDTTIAKDPGSRTHHVVVTAWQE